MAPRGATAGGHGGGLKTFNLYVWPVRSGR